MVLIFTIGFMIRKYGAQPKQLIDLMTSGKASVSFGRAYYILPSMRFAAEMRPLCLFIQTALASKPSQQTTFEIGKMITDANRCIELMDAKSAENYRRAERVMNPIDNTRTYGSFNAYQRIATDEISNDEISIAIDDYDSEESSEQEYSDEFTMQYLL